MSDDMTRREFVVGVTAMGGVLAVLSPPGMAMPLGRPAAAQVLLFDPEHAGACQKVAEAEGRCEKVPIVGFDMDYTLANYRQDRLEALSLEATVGKLVARGWPEILRDNTARIAGREYLQSLPADQP